MSVADFITFLTPFQSFFALLATLGIGFGTVWLALAVVRAGKRS